MGDAEGLADQICWAAEHRLELARMAERARAYAEEYLSFSATTRELLEWAASPTFAPDAGFRPTGRIGL